MLMARNHRFSECFLVSTVNDMTCATPTTLLRSELTELDLLTEAADLIAEDGIAAHEPTAESMVAIARRHRLTEILCRVLSDRTAPAVARERAYGRLAVELAASRARTFRSGGLAA